MAETRPSDEPPPRPAVAALDADGPASASPSGSQAPPSASAAASRGRHARPTREQLRSLPAQERADLLFRDAEILAPMVRASSAPLRALALRYGADLVYTEEIVDRAIAGCDRIENAGVGSIDYVKGPGGFAPKVRRRMRARNEIPVVLRILPGAEGGRLIYQMGTGEPGLALSAALKVRDDVDGIDVNMGCPKKFSVSGGMGSALLGDVGRACDVVRTLRRNLGGTPVSAKVRLLGDARGTVEFVRALVRAGANAVAIHARRVGDESTEPARWDEAVEVIRELKRTEAVPIILNGDLYTRDDMAAMRRRTGADGVMLARPALYNVSIFKKPPPCDGDGDEGSAGAGAGAGADANGEAGKYSYDSPLLESKTAVVREYLRHAVRYGTNAKNTKYVLCEMMNHRRTPPNLVPRMPMTFDGGQTIDAVCKTKSVEELCKLWDVGLSGVTRQKVDAAGWLDGKYAQKQPTAAAAAAAAPDVRDGDGDGRTYDDRYFLDPEGLKRDREAKGSARSEAAAGEEKKEAPADEDDDDAGKERKKAPRGSEGGAEEDEAVDPKRQRLE